MPTDPDPDPSSYHCQYDSREDVMDDLSSRFILNLPDEELESLERVCFQVEQAHWYYEDFIRENNPQFPSLPLKRFSEELFSHCPLLSHWRNDHEEAFNKFMQYKTRVPVCGAIMLNSKWDKCVLVKGWKSSSGWGFPKGKINELESKPNCAVREVLEETGYNMAGQISPAHVIELFIREQSISLYIVPDVSEDYPFETKTRKEISRIEWFRLSDLPTWKRNKTCQGKFYLISPFIAKLKEFINANKPRASVRKGTRLKKTSTPIDTSQESSSQSSDPHTPSPRSSELIPNVADSHHEERTMTPVHDPHMAFLLSKLSGSTQPISHSNSTPEMVFATQVSEIIPAEEECQTPIPTSTCSASVVVSVTTASAISSTPLHVQEPVTNVPATAPLAHATPTAHVPRPLSTVPDLSTYPSSTMSPVSPRLRSYRTKSTADISPYLPHSTATTTNESLSRQLRQISLLESMTQDIARRTQTSRASPPPPPMSAMDWKPNAPPLTGPPPPQVLPSVPFYPSPDAFRQGAPPNIPIRPYSVMDDAFQVRDRSQMGSRPPYAPPPFDPSRRHLLALMNDRPGTSMRTHFDYPSHPFPNAYRAPIPLDVIPVSHAPAPFHQPPFTAPLGHAMPTAHPTYLPSMSMPHHIHPPPANGNLQLLSLLNYSGNAAPANH